MTPFGMFVRTRRMELGLRQRDTAKALGVSGAMVSAVETGVKGPPASWCSRLEEHLQLDVAGKAELLAAYAATRATTLKPRARLVWRQIEDRATRFVAKAVVSEQHGFELIVACRAGGWRVWSDKLGWVQEPLCVEADKPVEAAQEAAEAKARMALLQMLKAMDGGLR